MKKSKFKPYIRRANGKEKSEDFRIALRLAFYQMLERPFFVMVQHGFPNLAIEVGASKKEIMKSILVVFLKQKTFKEWTKTIKRRCA